MSTKEFCNYIGKNKKTIQPLNESQYADSELQVRYLDVSSDPKAELVGILITFGQCLLFFDKRYASDSVLVTTIYRPLLLLRILWRSGKSQRVHIQIDYCDRAGF